MLLSRATLLAISPRPLLPLPPKPLTLGSPCTPAASITASIANSTSTSSSSSRKRGHEVLDEDTYVAAIERIIERDYFPDLPKLRDRLDWLEAVRSQDPVLIRDAQLKILERRRRQTPSASIRNPTPSVRTPSITPFAAASTPSDRVVNPNPAEGEMPEDAIDASVSLDDFFRRYTSEDNESFSRIMEKVNKKRRERYVHLFNAEKPDPPKALEMEKQDRITDGYGTSGQSPSTLESWKYSAKNLLMYVPAEEAPLTEDENAERLKGLTKEINRSSTRFHGNPGADDSKLGKDNAVDIVYNMVQGTTPASTTFPFAADREAERSKKYDLEDLRKTPNPFYVESVKKSDNGYSFVKTPSPAPGVDESPFITWGEIEGTPLRLDAEDTSVHIGGSSEGTHFGIPCPPARDVKAHSLSREAARKLRERSKMFQKPPLPSPARGGSASPSVRTLSPAAQKFVRNAIAKSSHSVDETLRASYRGASPVTSTPKEKSRFSRDSSLGTRSPSARQGSVPPW
ncbi:LOW QUALITY PROTEIN: splicing factor ESS-2 homolog [Dioscorea cayenensis subsp. rotundata]|uniref:LOW QUALITY PROTEIN: splicing factor ESS-2 homolog n=1 Tax=Dioscorea cayennensis subsp. rotundata TaxID=55577 RepID=A0AB40CY92_DIOCR|nr:LOW QUALITY PROTEIN: splicing factor ESS-2 homolog [Dioscorea cayenensis subsp. rotundata]